MCWKIFEILLETSGNLVKLKGGGEEGGEKGKEKERGAGTGIWITCRAALPRTAAALAG